MKFKTEDLQKVVAICKANYIKVYGFQKDTAASQVFVVDADGHIGTVSAGPFGHGVRYATVHKGSKNNGTGFGLTGYNDSEAASLDRIKDAMLTVTPSWACRETVEKYKDWNDYLSKPINQILTYFEL